MRKKELTDFEITVHEIGHCIGYWFVNLGVAFMEKIEIKRIRTQGDN